MAHSHDGADDLLQRELVISSGRWNTSTLGRGINLKKQKNMEDEEEFQCYM